MNKLSHKHNHPHTHGFIDTSVISHERGLWAVKWSFIGLMVTALLQVIVVVISHSVALLADTIHNFADAATAIPLAVAFIFARFKPTKTFTYGYGRIEDLAGVIVVLLILFSALVAGYESIQRFFHPVPVYHIWAIALASLISFIGNEAVAVFRIKVGKQIGSAALVADGYHARIDGFTSLAVLFGAIGIWLGYPLADPIIGLIITITILFIAWDSAKVVFLRMLDGVELGIIEEISNAINHVPGVKGIGEIRARWIGHKLYAEINVAVSSDISILAGHEIAKKINHEVLHHVPQLGKVVIHIDPEDKLGEEHHNHSHEF